MSIKHLVLSKHMSSWSNMPGVALTFHDLCAKGSPLSLMSEGTHKNNKTEQKKDSTNEKGHTETASHQNLGQKNTRFSFSIKNV